MFAAGAKRKIVIANFLISIFLSFLCLVGPSSFDSLGALRYLSTTFHTQQDR